MVKNFDRMLALPGNARYRTLVLRHDLFLAHGRVRRSPDPTRLIAAPRPAARGPKTKVRRPRSYRSLRSRHEIKRRPKEAQTMKPSPVLALIVITLGVPPTIAAQAPQPAPTNIAIRVTEARQANAALMRQYSCTSRTQVIDQGQVKDLRIDAVNYGPTGQLQRTVMNDQSAPLPFGFLRRRVAEYEREKVEEYLAGLRDLLEQYTLPTAGKVQDFMNKATASGPDASGLFEMPGQNVVGPGDTSSLWTDPRTRHAQKVQVSAMVRGDPVNLTATFKTLPSGLNHVAYAEVTVPAKQISVRVQNFDYNRNN